MIRSISSLFGRILPASVGHVRVGPPVALLLGKGDGTARHGTPKSNQDKLKSSRRAMAKASRKRNR